MGVIRSLLYDTWDDPPKRDVFPTPGEESLELARELFSAKLSKKNNNTTTGKGQQRAVEGMTGILKKRKTTVNMDTCCGLFVRFACNMDIILIKKFIYI